MSIGKYPFLLFFFCCALRLHLKAQHSETLFDSRLKMFVYDFVEKPPTFPGGEEALAKYLSKTLRYPKGDDYYQGTIQLSFVIDTAGNVIDKCILDKAESAYSLLDKEGIRVLDIMPKWIPGKHNGRKVAVRYHVPLRVCLQE